VNLLVRPLRRRQRADARPGLAECRAVSHGEYLGKILNIEDGTGDSISNCRFPISGAARFRPP